MECQDVRTWAVHLELVENQTSASFINALMRFRDRRGDPREIYSDNGKNFEGASKEIKQWVKEWDQEELSAAVKPWGVTWHFNPPEASHRGGIFESLIRPCRRILESISSDFTVLSREVMVTLLTEVERVMNNRPLCKVSSDPKDPETLTPAMLLTPRANWVTFPPGLPEGASHHKASWRLVQHLTDIFWSRWQKEYLQTLQKRSKWHMPQTNVQ